MEKNKFNDLFSNKACPSSNHDYVSDEPVKKNKAKKKEASIQAAFSAYIKQNYPMVVFSAEGSGVRLNMGQAVQAQGLRSKHKQPDMTILVARGAYHGLVMELKRDGKSPILKNGSFSTDKHVSEQRETLKHLWMQGYAATFGVGFDHCKALFERYISLRPGETMDVMI